MKGKPALGISLAFLLLFLPASTTIIAVPDDGAGHLDPRQLEARLATAPDTKKLELLLQLAEHYLSRQPEAVIRYASAAVELARTLNLPALEGRALVQQGAGCLQSGRLDEAESAYRRALSIGKELENDGIMGAAFNGVAAVEISRGDSTEALASFQRAILHLRRSGDRRRLAGVYNNISLIHYRSGELRKALDFMLRALKIYEDLKFQPGIGVVLNSIGNVYHRLNNPDQAMEHFRHALDIAEKTDNLQLQVVCRVNIGEIFKDRGKYSIAIDWFRQAHALAVKLGSRDYMAVCLNNMGDVYHSQGNWSAALESYRQSLKLFQSMDARPRMATSHLNMGNVYLDMRQLDLAEKHLKRAVSLAVDTESRSLQKDAVWSLIRLYEARHDLAGALRHYREYSTLQAQLFSRENYAKLSALQAKYESEHRLRQREAREREAHIRTLNRKRRTLVTLFLVSLLLLSAMILFYLYRRYRLRMRTELELREAYTRMEQMARFDNLTRLYNRHTIQERIEIEMVRLGRTWRPFCLIMLDVDDFKRNNDTYGHDCGDRLLRHLAELIRDNLRQADVAARWGGDEFLIMLPETDMDGGAVLAEKIRAVVASTPLLYQERKIALTVTLGINVFNKPGPVSECIRGADRAMYAGKKMGKNTVVRLDEINNDASSTLPGG